jgi:hypothetical protein
MSNPQQQVMFDALHGYRDKYGQPAVRALLERVAGVSAASEVPENYMQTVISACVNERVFARADATSKPRPDSLGSLATKAFARWNNPPQREQAE